MRAKRHIWAGWLLSLSFLLGAATNTFGSVLCVESDGRARIELACQPCCGSESTDHSSDTADVHDDHASECINCDDFSLDDLARVQRSSLIGLAGGPGLVFLTPPCLPASVPGDPGGRYLREPACTPGDDPPGQVTRVLAAAVLLC